MKLLHFMKYCRQMFTQFFCMYRSCGSPNNFILIKTTAVICEFIERCCDIDIFKWDHTKRHSIKMTEYGLGCLDMEIQEGRKIEFFQRNNYLRVGFRRLQYNLQSIHEPASYITNIQCLFHCIRLDKFLIIDTYNSKRNSVFDYF